MIRRPPRSTLFPLHDALPIWGQAARALPVTDAAAGTRATCLGPNRRDIMAGPQRLTEGNDNWSGFLAFDDYVLGLGGADIMNGAGGNDRLYGGAGGDTIRGGDGDDILDGGDDLQLVAVDSDNSSDHLLGEAGNDTLRGKNGDDVLDGGFGADNLYGGEGRDTLFSTSLGGTSFNVNVVS